jgi:hypothetical protein
MATSGRGTATGRRVVLSVTVLAVAALVLGIGAVRLFGSEGDRRPTAARLADGPAARAEDSIRLDAGPVDPGAVADCVTPGFAEDPSAVAVLYGVQQVTHDGSVPVLVLRNADGEHLLCDQYGADSPSQAPARTADDRHPVVFFSNGRRDWACAQGTRDLHRFTMTEWLAVGPQVRTATLRFVVDGEPGPWFVAQARHGFVHLLGWLDGPLPRGARLVVQHRVLDADGHRVPQSTLPAAQTLPGCAAGSVQLG